MKRFLLVGAIAAAFAMVSCDEVKEAIDDIQKDNEPTYVESKDGLTITVSYAKNGISGETIAKFKVDKSGKQHYLSDTVCTSFISKTSYVSEAVAKRAYEELKPDGDETGITYDDKKTITVDHGEYVGFEKPMAVWALQSILETYKMIYSGSSQITDIGQK
ncbi:MAG: hypothetical protein J6U22_07515 [Bacteroidaceae bacterium]|nr:hypothetical protein [Bacteroidaceae bacterium]